MRKLTIGAVVAVLLLAGCDSYSSPQNLETVTMKVGGRQYTIEVAATEESRQHGLMERDAMPGGWGMVFVFPDEQPRGFWMKNTRIPLDILYLDASGRIVSVHTMKAFDQRTTPSAGPAQFAIELNAGQVAENGAKAGQVIELPARVRELARTTR